MSLWWPGPIHDISPKRFSIRKPPPPPPPRVSFEEGRICLKNRLIQITLLEGLFIHPSISPSIRRSVRVLVHPSVRRSGHPAMGGMTIKWTRRSLGHSLLRSLVPSHRSLIFMLCTALFARVLRCAHSLARSLAHSVAYGKEVFVYELNVSISCSFNPL